MDIRFVSHKIVVEAAQTHNAGVGAAATVVGVVHDTDTSWNTHSHTHAKTQPTGAATPS